MNNRAVTMSVLMAILAMGLVDSYVSGIEERQRKTFGTEVQVMVASQDIKEMDTIDQTMVRFETVPKKFLQPGAISFASDDKDKEEKEGGKSNQVSMQEEIAGLVAIVPMKVGEQITRNKLTEPGVRTGLSPQVAPGKRAVALPVNDVTGVAKLVKPGDRVDVIAAIQVGNNRQDVVSKMVLQDVVVLAVGSHVTNNVPAVLEGEPGSSKKQKTRNLARSTSFNSVTVEVDPSQAQMVALLTSNPGNVLTLALRNNDDADRSASPGTALSDVIGTDGARFRLPAGGK